MKSYCLTLLFCTCACAHQGVAQQLIPIRETEPASDNSLFVSDLAIDQDGNRLAVGLIWTETNYDFDPSEAIVNLTSPSEVAHLTGYLASYSPTGSLNFAFPFTDADLLLPQSEAVELAIDGNNNVYVYGSFNGKIDLDPSEGVFEVRAPTATRRWSFVASYTQQGTLRWGFSLPFSFSVIGDQGRDRNFHVDNAGNVYLHAVVNSALGGDADPGPAEFLLENQEKYLLSYNPDGQFRFGWQTTLYAEDLGVSTNGEFVIAGTTDRFFSEDFDFDPGTGVTNIADADGQVAFFAAYNANGTFRNLNLLSGEGGGLATEIVEVKSDGGYYLIGYLLGTTDLDPGPGEAILEPDAFEFDPLGDLFVAEYNADGQFVQSRYFPDEVGQTSQGGLQDATIASNGDLLIALWQQLGAVDYGTEASPNLIDLTTTFAAELILGLSVEDLETEFVFKRREGANVTGVIPSSIAAHPTCEQYAIHLIYGNRDELTIELPAPNDNLSLPVSVPAVITAGLITLDLETEGVGECALPTSIVVPLSATQPLPCYPNPTHGILHFDLDNLPSSPTQVIVRNVFGQLVHQERLLTGEHKLNLTQLSPGIYHLLVRSTKKTYASSFIKH